jgi:hypothetical protein
MNVRFILFLYSYQIYLINSFQNLIFITSLVRYSVYKLGNKAWENLKTRIHLSHEDRVCRWCKRETISVGPKPFRFGHPEPKGFQRAQALDPNPLQIN